MAEKGLGSAPNAAAGVPFIIGGPTAGFYPLGPETGLPTSAHLPGGTQLPGGN